MTDRRIGFPSPRRIPADIEKQLVTREHLEEVRHLSMRKRVLWIAEKMGVKLCIGTLRTIYLRNQVTLRQGVATGLHQAWMHRK